MNDPMGIAADDGNTAAVQTFLARLGNMDAPRVLEMGTLRWEANRPTHHKVWAPHASEYIMSDVSSGTDVDVVADAHDLISVFKPRSFDAIIAVSVWEHLARPWIAAKQLARVLKPGGVAYVATHQTFPLHGYPHDYFRFSAEGLALLFDDAGMGTCASYAYPCKIVPPRVVTRWNRSAESFLNVDVCAWNHTKDTTK